MIINKTFKLANYKDFLTKIHVVQNQPKSNLTVPAPPSPNNHQSTGYTARMIEE